MSYLNRSSQDPTLQSLSLQGYSCCISGRLPLHTDPFLRLSPETWDHSLVQTCLPPKMWPHALLPDLSYFQPTQAMIILHSKLTNQNSPTISQSEDWPGSEHLSASLSKCWKTLCLQYHRQAMLLQLPGSNSVSQIETFPGPQCPILIRHKSYDAWYDFIAS